jgi:hypothetical protein
MMTSLVLALLLQNAPAEPQDAEAAKKEEAAKAAIGEYSSKIKKAKTNDEKIMAIQAVNRMPHPLILKELLKALKETEIPVRKAVVYELTKYRKNKSAGEALVKMLSSEAAQAKLDPGFVYAGHEMFMAVCQALSSIQFKPAAAALVPFFTHANLEVAKTAIRTAGELKSVETVDAMLAIYREWANAKVDDPYAGGNTPASGNGFFVKHGNSAGGKPQNYTSEQLAKIDKFNRKNQIPQTVNASLIAISDLSYQTLAEWDKWWAANKTPLLKEAKEKAKNPDEDE